MFFPKRGEIYYINNNNTEKVGSEQSGIRPAVIISNNTGNLFSPVVIVAFLTTRDKKPIPTHVSTSACPKPSTILCEQIATISKDRIGDFLGQMPEEEMKDLDKAMSISLGLKQEGRHEKN